MARILVVEDEETLVATLRYSLEKEGHEVFAAEDGNAALATAREAHPELVLLDLMLPGVHGFEVCRLLRAESTVPIIMLTARTEEVDRVVGLELGADDYVTKPFSMKELVARVHAQLRRANQAPAIHPEQVLTHEELRVDLGRREVTRGSQVVVLKPKEFDLLAFLMQNRGWTFTRDQLLRRVWGYEPYGRTRTVDVHVGELRQKIEPDPENPTRILTLRGVGYRFAG